MRKGSRTEEFTATELADDEKLPLLRAYLKKWAWQVGAFFQGFGAISLSAMHGGSIGDDSARLAGRLFG